MPTHFLNCPSRPRRKLSLPLCRGTRRDPSAVKLSPSPQIALRNQKSFSRFVNSPQRINRRMAACFLSPSPAPRSGPNLPSPSGPRCCAESAPVPPPRPVGVVRGAAPREPGALEGGGSDGGLRRSVAMLWVGGGPGLAWIVRGGMARAPLRKRASWGGGGGVARAGGRAWGAVAAGRRKVGGSQHGSPAVKGN